ncbi:MAG: DNA (cytosine-5-)-methyltransferase [Agitococcus sp.]|nr:DNA (cytosine-5-)-methyltransferase [Agitococcus sp.]
MEVSGEVSKRIRAKREILGMTQLEFAQLLGLQDNGERTISGWERGEHHPSPSKLAQITGIQTHTPFKQPPTTETAFTFIDLFAGIGGIRLPYQQAGGRCVFSSEWDKFSQKTYAANFGELPAGDITQISAHTIPQHDILLGGFPCQTFSQAGLKRGFSDTRGTMFFEIQRIIAQKRPKAFMLENVKQLQGHEKGRTLQTIVDILEGRNVQEISADIPMSEDARQALSHRLNYQVFYKVLRAADFGIPQNRERIFIVGFDRDYYGQDIDFNKLFSWPTPPCTPTRVGDILEDSLYVDSKYTISEKLWDGHRRRKEEHKTKGNGFGYSLFHKNSTHANTLSARYYKDGSEILIDQSDIHKRPRKLTPRECARLQGFPENYIVNAVSDVQAYKQFGNSVTVPVIRAVATQLLAAMTAAQAVQSKYLSKSCTVHGEPVEPLA